MKTNGNILVNCKKKISFFTIGMASTFAVQQPTTNSLFGQEQFQTPLTSVNATPFNKTQVDSVVATPSGVAKRLGSFGQTLDLTGNSKSLFISLLFALNIYFFLLFTIAEFAQTMVTIDSFDTDEGTGAIGLLNTIDSDTSIIDSLYTNEKASDSGNFDDNINLRLLYESESENLEESVKSNDKSEFLILGSIDISEENNDSSTTFDMPRPKIVKAEDALSGTIPFILLVSVSFLF